MDKFYVWAKSIDGHTDFQTQARSRKGFTRLYNDLVKEGRREEALAVARELVRVSGSDYMRLRPQLFVARNLMSQSRLTEAREELNVLVDAQEARRKITGSWSSYEAWERAWRYIAEMDLAIRMGHMDRAASYLPLAEEECALAEAGRGVASLAYVRRTIEYTELRILLGSGRISDLIARIQVLRADLEEGTGADKEVGEKLERMEITAWSFGVMRGLREPEEAQTFLAPLYEDEAKPILTRYEAAYRSAHLHSLRGNLSQARIPLALARRLANKPQQHAELASVAGRLAMQEPGPFEVQADEEWQSAAEEYFDRLASAPISETGSGAILFGRRRQVCSVGIELALARWPDQPQHAFDRFLNYERFSYLPPRLRERYGRSKALNLARLQEDLLSPGQLVLAPILEDGGCLLLAATTDEAHFFPLGPWLPLREALTQMNAYLRTPSPDGDGSIPGGLKQAGETLGGLMFPGPAQRLVRAAQHVIVIESGSSLPLPLQLAHMDGEPLGLQKPMSRMPSLTAMWHRRGPDPLATHGHGVLVTNISDGDKDSAQLLGIHAPIVLASEELDRLRNTLDPPMRLRTGAEASTEALGSGALAGASLGVLIAHGVQDRSLVRTPTLLLGSREEGGDGLWSCAEVEQSPVADVVLLASCRAGAGAQRPGDSHANDLGGAFLLAGARAVVLSQGDLPQQATLLFTERFCSGLGEGQTVSKAAHRARQAVAAIPDFGAPFFHSQLQVLGEGSFRPFPSAGRLPSTNRNLAGWVALGVLPLLLLAWVLRKRIVGGCR